MLDQYENCLFSESCLCGVDLRVDVRNPTMFLQWDTLTSLLNRFLLSVLWDFERPTCISKFRNHQWDKL